MKNTVWSCRMERLEDRRLLAGNVSAQLVDGSLRIVGDAQNNDIVIEQDFVAEVLRVNGIDTTINGDSMPAEFNIPSNIRIILADGNDRVVSRDAQASNTFSIDTGNGNDAIFMDGGLSMDLTIRTGAGRDVITLTSTSVNDTGLIESGEGRDFISIYNGFFSQQLIVRTGPDRDTIFHQNLTGSTPRRFVLGGGEDKVASKSIIKTYDFRNGALGWSAGFADFRSGQEQAHQLAAGIRKAPLSIGGKRAFFIKGLNSTDDLFMYLTRQLGTSDGLKAATQYQLFYSIDFGSNAQSGCAGIGGAPGESVFLKAGASKLAPRTRPDKEGIERLNIDHGQQGNAGKVATVLGNIANGQECDGEPSYVTQHRRGVHQALVRTDRHGRLHLIVGTDSGFEGTTALYYKRIRVQLVEAE
jgi:hypothetical protein